MRKRYLLTLFLIILFSIICQANENIILEDYFSNQYIEVNIGIKYEDVINILTNFSLQFTKIDDNQIIIEKSISSNKNINYTVFNFNEDKLIDILVVIEIEDNNIDDALNYISNELKDNNYSEENIKEGKIFYDNPITTIEISKEKVDDGISWLSLHYYYNEFALNKKPSIDIAKYFRFKNFYEMSFNAGLYYNPASFSRYDSDLYYNMDVGGLFSYSCYYYLLRNFAIGFSTRLNFGYYKPLFTIIESKDSFYSPFDDDYNYVNVGIDFKFVTKFGKIYNKYKLLLEYGVFLGGIFNTTTIDDIEESHYFFNHYIEDFFQIGPNLFVGFEYRNGYYNYVFGGIVRTYFGKAMFHDSQYYEDYYKKKEIYTQMISIGFEWRWGLIFSKPFIKK